jgi:hypothetical protein
MFRKVTLAAAAAVTALTVIPAAAQAQPRGNAYGYWNNSAHARSDYRRDYRRDDYRRYERGDRYGSYDRGYGSYDRGYDGYGRGERYEDDYYGRSSHDGDRRCSGTTGTVIGGVAGAVAGRSIDRNSGRYGSRGGGTTGAIIGGALGALAGRAVDKSGCRNDRRY